MSHCSSQCVKSVKLHVKNTKSEKSTYGCQWFGNYESGQRFCVKVPPETKDKYYHFNMI